uniref:Cytochrome c oxidase subunit 3 n=1 Tax=Linepithema humile TaxID=83485 RepID=A0A0S2A3C1_LINHU|nr:cytochrome c oxidase subunit III [Linepithema humile]
MSMSVTHNHPFHLVSVSPWPIIISFNLMNNLIMVISWFHKMNYFTLLTIPGTLLCMYQWWRDVTREATLQGCHTPLVYNGMRMGMILFIVSEILIFFLFCSLFSFIIIPGNSNWTIMTPFSDHPFSSLSHPFIKYHHLSFLSTNCHMISPCYIKYYLYSKNYQTFNNNFISNLFFSITTYWMYWSTFHNLSFCLWVKIFCSYSLPWITRNYRNYISFFTFYRMNLLHFSSIHHFGFEAAAWYWHFVDVVWLFLYVSIYWWSF